MEDMAVDFDAVTDALKRLIDSPDCHFNIVNRAGHEDDIINGDIKRACLVGRIVAVSRQSTRQSAVYALRSRSISHEERFLEIELVLDLNNKIIKVLTATVI